MNDRTYPEMQENHFTTSDNKIKWWGYGEWVEEPDCVQFTYKDFKCRVLRIAQRVPCAEEHIFGGHLCGYVQIPEDHPYFNKPYDENIDCHGGLTYAEFDIYHWIGFDCAHSNDIVPSMEHLEKTTPEIIEFRQQFPAMGVLFKPTYKNVRFCVNECMDIVDQLIVIAEAEKDDN